MIFDLTTTEGYVYAYIVFQVVDTESKLSKTGEHLFINGFWVRFSASLLADAIIYVQAPAGFANYNLICLRSAGGVRFTTQVASSIVFNASAPFTPVPDEWVYLAFVRKGANFYIFKDGVLLETTIIAGELTAETSLPNINAVVEIGRWMQNTNFFPGHVDEFRISKGIARWTTDFTPPIRSYSNDVAKINGISVL